MHIYCKQINTNVNGCLFNTYLSQIAFYLCHVPLRSLLCRRRSLDSFYSMLSSMAFVSDSFCYTSVAFALFYPLIWFVFQLENKLSCFCCTRNFMMRDACDTLWSKAQKSIMFASIPVSVLPRSISRYCHKIVFQNTYYFRGGAPKSLLLYIYS